MLLTKVFRQNESEVDSKWHSFMERAHQHATSIKVDRSSPEPRAIYDEDNPLWKVPCKVRIILCYSMEELQVRQQVGYKEITVFNIMKWLLHDEIPATGGIAVFGCATLPG